MYIVYIVCFCLKKEILLLDYLIVYMLLIISNISPYQVLREYFNILINFV